MSIDNRFIDFNLGKGSFGIPISFIQQVISPQPTTKVAGVPDYYLGIVNIRGDIIPIIDLRKKLKITPNTENSQEAIIVLNLNNVSIGILVDSVNKVVTYTEDMMHESPTIETEKNNNYIYKIYKGKDSLTAMLDISEIFKVMSKIKPKESV